MLLPEVFGRPWLAVVLALIGVGVSMVLRDIAAAFPVTGVERVVMVTLATTVPILAVAVCAPVLTTSTGFRRATGLTRPRLRDLGMGVCAGLVVRAITELVSPTMGTAIDSLGRGIVPAMALSLLVAVAVSPFIEELLFRGVLQRALADGLHASGAAVAAGVSVAMSTAVFVLSHLTTGVMNAGLLVSTISVSVVCGLLVAMTGRLAGAIIAHAVHNAIGVALLLW